MSLQGHESFTFHPPNDTNPLPTPSPLTYHHQTSTTHVNEFCELRRPIHHLTLYKEMNVLPVSSGITPYKYGSDSRPQSRCLTVMELWNDDEQRKQQRNEQQYRENGPRTMFVRIWSIFTISSSSSTIITDGGNGSALHAPKQLLYHFVQFGHHASQAL